MVISAPLSAPGATRLFSRLWSHQARWLGVYGPKQRDVNVALPQCGAWRRWGGLYRSEHTGPMLQFVFDQLTAQPALVHWSAALSIPPSLYLSIHPPIHQTKGHQAGACNSFSTAIYEQCIVVNTHTSPCKVLTRCWDNHIFVGAICVAVMINVGVDLLSRGGPLPKDGRRHPWVAT